MWLCTQRQLVKVGEHSLVVGDQDDPVNSVCDLGVIVDSQLMMPGTLSGAVSINYGSCAV